MIHLDFMFIFSIWDIECMERICHWPMLNVKTPKPQFYILSGANSAHRRLYQPMNQMWSTLYINVTNIEKYVIYEWKHHASQIEPAYIQVLFRSMVIKYTLVTTVNTSTNPPLVLTQIFKRIQEKFYILYFHTHQTQEK